MQFVASFLLCFLDEEMSFWAFCRLYEELIPEIFSIEQEPIQNEMYMLIEAAKDLGFLDQMDVDPLRKSLHSYLSSAMINIFVNCMSFQCTYFIWDNAFSKGSVLIH